MTIARHDFAKSYEALHLHGRMRGGFGPSTGADVRSIGQAGDMPGNNMPQARKAPDRVRLQRREARGEE